jgi:hypothetical protein
MIAAKLFPAHVAAAVFSVLGCGIHEAGHGTSLKAANDFEFNEG